MNSFGFLGLTTNTKCLIKALALQNYIIEGFFLDDTVESLTDYRIFKNPFELIQKSDCVVINNTVPNSTGLIIESIYEGKKIFVEYPLNIDYSEACNIAKLAAEAGVELYLLHPEIYYIILQQINPVTTQYINFNYKCYNHKYFQTVEHYFSFCLAISSKLFSQTSARYNSILYPITDVDRTKFYRLHQFTFINGGVANIQFDKFTAQEILSLEIFSSDGKYVFLLENDSLRIIKYFLTGGWENIYSIQYQNGDFYKNQFETIFYDTLNSCRFTNFDRLQIIHTASQLAKDSMPIETS